MYYKISDFISDWKYESEATIKVFNNLTDDSVNKKFGDEIRTAGRLAWHIVTSIGEMVQRTGLSIDTIDDNAPVPQSAKEIINEYKRASANMAVNIQKNWNDDTLMVEDEMYGQKWVRGKTLGVLVTHQIHHRAQLTVIMRLAGLKVPGVYGPSKEEWVKYGMEPQD